MTKQLLIVFFISLLLTLSACSTSTKQMPSQPQGNLICFHIGFNHVQYSKGSSLPGMRMVENIHGHREGEPHPP